MTEAMRTMNVVPATLTVREAEILVEDLRRYAAGNGLPAIEMSSSVAELS